VFSATKSFTSTLVGIAQDDGDLHAGDKASTWIPEWQGTASGAVTVRDLLSMCVLLHVRVASHQSTARSAGRQTCVRRR
jgi:hypothetical protein